MKILERTARLVFHSLYNLSMQAIISFKKVEINGIIQVSPVLHSGQNMYNLNPIMRRHQLTQIKGHSTKQLIRALQKC